MIGAHCGRIFLRQSPRAPHHVEGNIKAGRATLMRCIDGFRLGADRDRHGWNAVHARTGASRARASLPDTGEPRAAHEISPCLRSHILRLDSGPLQWSHGEVVTGLRGLEGGGEEALDAAHRHWWYTMAAHSSLPRHLVARARAAVRDGANLGACRNPQRRSE